MKNLDYGIIGNCKSAALISKTGSIDWCCLPNFDSASVFAKLLDKDRGGSFEIKPVGSYNVTQRYISRTNILQTRFDRGDDAFVVLDFMPRYITERNYYHCPPEIIRYIRVLSGSPKVQFNYNPRPAYAQYDTEITVTDEFIKQSTTKGTYESLYLYSDLPLSAIAESKPVALPAKSYVQVSYNQKVSDLNLANIDLEYERTKVYWMGWAAKTTIVTDYPNQVERSALVLKLLAYQKSGAILAAATTSLPETIGEPRNWDYRYCWIRDASMTINILTKLGHYNVAKRFLQFILDIVPYKDEKVQIMYGINSQKRLTEKELPWLAGYENSKPVRIGNGAALQKQNDIYGVLMDVIYQSLSLFSSSIDNKEDLWTVVRTLVRHVKKNWKKLDSGIWEFRSEKKHFTFSKLLCWVAMDRAAKIASLFQKIPEIRDYMKLRDQIKRDILEKGRHPETGALTQFYGGTSLDASNLLAEHYGFLSANDPIYISTVMESYKHLCNDGLMYRYKDADDFGLPKSSFTICSFWMIKSLYRIGKHDLAKSMFNKLLSYANHLGLLSEDLDFKTKRLLGNFPQGYSHIALIDTAMALSNVPEWHHGYSEILHLDDQQLD
jgi:GH15 family glucan-1,4-alpha-glucosidase